VNTIQLKTPIPGPKSTALMARRKAAVSNSPFIVTPVFAEHGRGAALTDVDDNTFLDFAGGIGTVNVGHAHPRVVAAIRAQSEKLLHTCFNVAQYEPYVALAEKLNAMVPSRGPRKTVLFNSGAEAVENAVKIARCVTGRPGVVTFEHGFAGRTYMAMSLRSKAVPYKAGFAPFVPEVYRLPYPYVYRDARDGESEDAYAERMLAPLREFFHTHVAPRQVACVWMELVTGEGGFIVAPRRYVQGLRRLCDEHGIVLILDEIQTGFGRTGRLFAAEHYGVEADLVTLAKSLAGGLPLSAVVGRADLLDGVPVGGLGGTFGGNPVSCAAALATLEVFEEEQVVAHAGALGRQLMQRLQKWFLRFPRIGNVRGLGPMCALEFVTDRGTREPDKEYLASLSKRCCARGVLLISSGTHGNVLRFLFPLVITPEQLDEGLAVIEEELENG